MPAFQLPKLYPITDSKLSGLSHVEQVIRLIDGGATLIQLRDKHSSGSELFTAAKEAVAIARQHHVKIIINDRVDIALAIGADGVHLGQDDLPPEKARQILGPGAMIGLSTHTVEQARTAAAMPVDYIAFGPVFTTRTKQNPDPTTGLEFLRAVRDIVRDKPLVGIGGIDQRNIASVMDAGVDSAAVISYLLSEPQQISTRTRELLNIVNI